VVVGDQVNANAAWFYPRTQSGGREIQGRGGFLEGRVQVR